MIWSIAKTCMQYKENHCFNIYLHKSFFSKVGQNIFCNDYNQGQPFGQLLHLPIYLVFLSKIWERIKNIGKLHCKCKWHQKKWHIYVGPCLNCYIIFKPKVLTEPSPTYPTHPLLNFITFYICLPQMA